MGKERVTTFVEKDVKDKLEDGKKNRSLSNHVADILTVHVQKKEIDKPFVSKKEYND